MDHDEALGLIETAAAEPYGLDRLMAGDTADAARVAGHLAGCPACAQELHRIRRTASIVRAFVRERPSPDLRERTLAFVRDMGRPARSRAAPATSPASSAARRESPDGGPAEGSVDGRPAPASGARRTASAGWILWQTPAAWAASVAGAALLATVVTLAAGAADRAASEQRVAAAEERSAGTIAALAKVAAWTLRIDGEADGRRVVMRATNGSAAEATLYFSPTTTELVVVATALAEAPEGQEYRCWLEVGGRRERIGRMVFGGGVAYWVGSVPAVGQVQAGARFGISPAPVGSDAIDAPPLMTGQL